MRRTHSAPPLPTAATLLLSASAVASAAFAGAEPVTCQPPGGGLVARYPADGSTDDVALGNDGTLENGASYGSGRFGQAFHLDGDDDRITAASIAETDPTTQGSIAAWVRLGSLPSAAGHIMEVVGRGSSGRDFDLQVNTDDHAAFYVQAGFAAGSSTTLEAGTWYHLAGTWDASGIRFYVNGVLENENLSSVTRVASEQALMIGDQPWFGPRHFAGDIDEVQIFDRALSALDVANLACAEFSSCADANSDGSVKAGDALLILKHAVGQPVECPATRCDIDGNASILASDALRALEFAVGQTIELLCPAA